MIVLRLVRGSASEGISDIRRGAFTLTESERFLPRTDGSSLSLLGKTRNFFIRDDTALCECYILMPIWAHFLPNDRFRANRTFFMRKTDGLIKITVCWVILGVKVLVLVQLFNTGSSSLLLQTRLQMLSPWWSEATEGMTINRSAVFRNTYMWVFCVLTKINNHDSLPKLVCLALTVSQ